MIQITVGKKKPDHPTYGKGSTYAYVINGQEGKTLELVRGETYKFSVDAEGHPFYFTTDSVNSNSDKDSLMGPNESVTDKGTTSFTVRDDLPNTFYYQCQRHPYMGGKVMVVDESNKKKLFKYLMISDYI
jgi:hypothetical protein